MEIYNEDLTYDSADGDDKDEVEGVVDVEGVSKAADKTVGKSEGDDIDAKDDNE